MYPSTDGVSDLSKSISLTHTLSETLSLLLSLSLSHIHTHNLGKLNFVGLSQSSVSNTSDRKGFKWFQHPSEDPDPCHGPCLSPKVLFFSLLFLSGSLDYLSVVEHREDHFLFRHQTLLFLISLRKNVCLQGQDT